MSFLAKIAVELEQAVAIRAENGDWSTSPIRRVLAEEDGWSVDDLICTCDRHDRPFEEEHSRVSIAIVLSGTFQYRAATVFGRADQLMTPGSLLLGNPGQAFQCGHEHGAGDRCLSFHFLPDYFEQIAADAGACRGERGFRAAHLPALRELSPVIARACARMASVSGVGNAAWEEIAVRLAAQAVRVANGAMGVEPSAAPSTIARVTRAVRRIEDRPESEHSLGSLADGAGLSRYHFLRTFEQITGLTPHQYVRRARLRRAATRLLMEPGSILDVALDSGFGDVSNFNHAFRIEFGVSPRQFRRQELPPPEVAI